MTGICRVVLLLLTCSACTNQRYPAEWSPPVARAVSDAPNRCPLLAGHYSDRGRSDSLTSMPLMKVFGRDPGFRWRGGGSVTIAQFGDDSLVVSFADTARSSEDTASSKPSSRVVLRQKDGDFTCRAEGLELSEWDVAAADIIAAVSRMRYRVRRAVDGALVVHRRETAVGVLAVVIPVGAREQKWFRFPSLP